MESEVNLGQKRVLIFIVAYNAEKTLAQVLKRIPASLHTPQVEVLVIDDHSKDDTFSVGVSHEESVDGLRITVLRTTENQGYGGNQKLGYQYAIRHGFDIVALVHGDGQYAPEKLPELLGPLVREEADAVFGSRMLEKKLALQGGMPLYKWVGNQVLTKFQNRMLGTHLSEFHSGYRLYSVEALKQVPFDRNSNDFHFDTDIIIQFVRADLVIAEIQIPTFYGDEICHVNGMKYAGDVFLTMIRNRFHSMNLLYDRKFDIGSARPYGLKLGYASSHTAAAALLKKGAKILVVGLGDEDVSESFSRQLSSPGTKAGEALSVTFHRLDPASLKPPDNLSDYDQILLLDVLDRVKEPEAFMESFRWAMGVRRPEIILTVGNVGFFIVRLVLLLGWFNYGRKGILDRTHTRLFTAGSLVGMLRQAGYKILAVQGLPAPFPEAIGLNFRSRFLLGLNSLLIHLSKGLFSYQIFVRAQALPTVDNLLSHTIESSLELKKAHAAAVR